jgi:hypothetical protein
MRLHHGARLLVANTREVLVVHIRACRSARAYVCMQRCVCVGCVFMYV